MSTVDEQKLKKLKELLEMVNESLTREEFTKAFRTVLEFVLKIRDRNEEKMRQMESMHEDMMRKLEEMMRVVNKQMSEMQSENLKALKEQHEGMKFIYDRVQKLRGNKIFTVEKIQNAPSNSKIGDIMIVEGTGDIYIFE